ncbi:MAG: glutamate synthase large subunit [Verrucomicrobiota bacterium]
MSKNQSYMFLPPAEGLYNPQSERDNCGVGFVANVHGNRSNRIISKALGCVCNLQHRGAVDADAKSGDGAGVLTQIPVEIFKPLLKERGHELYNDSDLGVGMFFLPLEDAYRQAHIRKITEDVIEEAGLVSLGWREVPVNPKVLGDKAAATRPQIEQIFILRPDADKLNDDQYERTLYWCRRKIEKQAQEEALPDFYISSLSARMIVYKGMFTAPQLERYFDDLHNPEYKTTLALFHQRYSTNTFPTWGLAQPFRMLAHNGEINTVRGNRNWVRAREADFASPLWEDRSDSLEDVIQKGSSDSASLDNALELVAQSGRDVLHTMMMMVPAAFRSERGKTDPDVQGFYEFHELMAEPWDGPAALAVTDGRMIAACLDRNGLRPARYKITSDGMLLMSSEVGVGRIPEETIVEKGRLAPGEMIAVDTQEGILYRSEEIKKMVASKQPYSEWVKDHLKDLSAQDEEYCHLDPRELEPTAFAGQAGSFGYSDEELQMILKPIFQVGQEPLGSMGDDTPLAALSQRPRPLYHYFRQLFAQVTNPAIDPIREKLVMDTQAILGTKLNWLDESPEHAKQLRLDTPVLTNRELQAIKSFDEPHLKSATISTRFKISGGHEAFETALQHVCQEAEAAVDEGKSIIILSDQGVSAEEAPLPMLLVVGAVHHHLIREGKRMKASIVCETGEARDVHQFACLIGYGASAINPYLTWDLAAKLIADGKLGDTDEPTAIKNYVAAIDKGLLKIMSKMGISKLASYHGAQIFEAVGIHRDIVDKYFTATDSFIGGIGLTEISRETIQRHETAYRDAESPKPPQAGFYRYRRDGEMHSITPPVLQSLHKFVGIKGPDKANNKEDYRKFVDALTQNRPVAIRDLFRFKPRKAVPLDEVEPADEILKRFTSAGMSFGALSPESHEALAIAMNRIGGKSNSGEGGEDKDRFTPMENGDSKNSRIKQVASGRFGVTAEYLASAEEIEIKISQGAKPGEGGQIPGHKVSALIARLRHSTPGVMLISPPPHHDIYSIEDLAQLIYDLKQVNPRAKVCVKLVAEAGVGTIAAGVAKAHADIILVSGHDGGTGASPLSSIKFAGSPWEIGVAETQQVLLLNDLRNRITLRTDGGMRTGRDIVTAAILGAEEYNFGTAALLVQGCVYVRQCHLNTCPVGIATQDEKLRGKFKGSPDGFVTYLKAIADEVREIMAELGVRKMEELIGHTEFLEQISIPDHPKANTVDLGALLHVPDIDDLTPRYHTWERNDKLEDRPLDGKILQDVKSTLQTQKPINLEYKVHNINRSIGTQLSGEIAYRFGDQALPDRVINLDLTGSAGQSFGVFLVKGVRLYLKGEANDYVGKGMTGGEIILVPHPDATFDASKNIICGNTCLYGATGGNLFIYGMAGERFAVRNSGARTVVEGVGDHGCEYMTNGVVVVTGPTGKNFGAGMSGGCAFVLDPLEEFPSLYNADMVAIERVEQENDETLVKGLLYEHLEATESKRSKEILGNWEHFKSKFWKVVPKPAAAPIAASAKLDKPALKS